MIEFRNLTLAYDRRPAVHHLSGTIDKGSLTALVGPNGSGKSTLLRAIAGLVTPLEGEIRLNGVSHRKMGYLSQQPSFDLQFPLTVQEFVGLARVATRGLFQGLQNSDHEIIARSLDEVGLQSVADKNLDELSGGQLQRARFARLSAQGADVLLLDEPFSHLDPRTTLELSVLIKRWHAEGKTILIVLHELELARSLCPEIFLLARQTVARGPADLVLTKQNLEQAHANLQSQSPLHWCEGPHDLQ